jgi:hypothetical protein
VSTRELDDRSQSPLRRLAEVVRGLWERVIRGSPRWFVVLFGAWMLLGTGLLVAIVAYSVWVL